MQVVSRERFFAFGFGLALAAAGAVAGASAGQISAADALAQKFAEATKTPAQRAEEQRAADEKEMLARARAEAEARRSADLKAAAAKPAALIGPSMPSPAPTAAETLAKPMVPVAVPAAAQAQALAPAKTAEATPQPQQQPQTQKIVAAEQSAPPADTAAANGSRVSILLVLNPGQSDEKRAASKSSPVICLKETCYISAGSSVAAKAVARADATKAGADAAACVGKPRCVFRSVSLPPGSFIQIVDLGPAKLIRMETIEARADASCHVSDGTLDCKTPITAPDYRIWLVPESAAEKAGAAELDAAVADELPEENVSQVSDK